MTQIIEGNYYRVKSIPEKIIREMGFPLIDYPANEVVKVTDIDWTDNGWCTIVLQNHMVWDIKIKYLMHNCIWEVRHE